MKNYGDTVYAAECAPCGVTFDFRAKDDLGGALCFCPICQAPTEVRAHWGADDGGYHVSRKVIILLAEDRGRILAELREHEVGGIGVVLAQERAEHEKTKAERDRCKTTAAAELRDLKAEHAAVCAAMDAQLADMRAECARLAMAAANDQTRDNLAAMTIERDERREQPLLCALWPLEDRACGGGCGPCRLRAERDALRVRAERVERALDAACAEMKLVELQLAEAEAARNRLAGREMAMREALTAVRDGLSSLLGMQHVLKYAAKLIVDWKDDPAWLNAENRIDSIDRIVRVCGEWHAAVVGMSEPVRAVLDSPDEAATALLDRERAKARGERDAEHADELVGHANLMRGEMRAWFIVEILRGPLLPGHEASASRVRDALEDHDAALLAPVKAQLEAAEARGARLAEAAESLSQALKMQPPSPNAIRGPAIVAFHAALSATSATVSRWLSEREGRLIERAAKALEACSGKSMASVHAEQAAAVVRSLLATPARGETKP